MRSPLHRFPFPVCAALLAALFSSAARPASAMAQRVYPLAEVLKVSNAVARGLVVARDTQNVRVAFQVREPLKGSLPFRWMDVDLRPSGWVGPGDIMRRVAPGLPVLLFATKVRTRYVVLIFTQGTWFQISAPDGKDRERLAWTLTRGDPLLRRTFAGTTSELEQTVRDALAGRKQPPPPNPGQAGLGPEVPPSFKPSQPLPPLPPFLTARYAGAIAKPVPAPGAADDAKRFAAVPAADRAEAQSLAREFSQPAATVVALYKQAKGRLKDVRVALTLARDHGRGGNRAYVRSPEEILALKQASARLTWLDIKGCLQRAGELFRPVDDSALLIYRLRHRFTWDELDPLFNDDKWQKIVLDDVIAQRLKERMPHPLLPRDRLRPAAYAAEFGRALSGGPQMESIGWAPLPGSPPNLARRQYAWNGRDSTAPQAPGRQIVRAPDSAKSEMPNRPPRPGSAFAGGRGSYGGAALWLANGVGDYAGRNVSLEGSFAYYDAGWVVTPPKASRSFLIDTQIFTPDHSDEVGEPRAGWYNGSRRGSRYVGVGVRLADGATRTASIGPPTLVVPLETAPDRWDRVLLRVEVKPGFVTLIACIGGVGEVGRATAKVDAKAGVAVAPLVGIRRPGEGFAPEFYVGSLTVAAINGPSLTIAKGAQPIPPAPAPRPAVAAAAAKTVAAAPNPPAPAPPDDPVLRLLRAHPSPRRVAIVVDHSGSMQPRLPRAREIGRQILQVLGPKDAALVVAMDQQVQLLGGYLRITPQNRAQLGTQLDQIGAGAATDYGQMLEKVLATRPTLILLIGDADPPTRGLQDLNALLRLKKERNVTRATLHVVAIRTNLTLPDENVARRLAESTGGRAIAVHP